MVVVRSCLSSRVWSLSLSNFTVKRDGRDKAESSHRRWYVGGRAACWWVENRKRVDWFLPARALIGGVLYLFMHLQNCWRGRPCCRSVQLFLDSLGRWVSYRLHSVRRPCPETKAACGVRSCPSDGSSLFHYNPLRPASASTSYGWSS